MPSHRRHSPFNTPATIAPNPITLKYMTLARSRGRTASTITGSKRFAEPLAQAGSLVSTTGISRANGSCRRHNEGQPRLRGEFGRYLLSSRPETHAC